MNNFVHEKNWLCWFLSLEDKCENVLMSPQKAGQYKIPCFVNNCDLQFWRKNNQRKKCEKILMCPQKAGSFCTFSVLNHDIFFIYCESGKVSEKNMKKFDVSSAGCPVPPWGLVIDSSGATIHWFYSRHNLILIFFTQHILRLGDTYFMGPQFADVITYWGKEAHSSVFRGKNIMLSQFYSNFPLNTSYWWLMSWWGTLEM